MNSLSASAKHVPTNHRNRLGSELRNESLYNSKIAAKISPYLAIEDYRNFAISGKQQQTCISNYWQTRIEQLGLTDIEVTKTTKITFIRQFENTSEAKKNILFMNKIGFSNQQILKMNRREIDQIREDYTVTKVVLDCYGEIEESDLETLQQQLKEDKLNNVIKAFVNIKKAQNKENDVTLSLNDLSLRSGDLAALIPEIQKRIPTLIGLNVDDNQLKELPASIGDLTALAKLDSTWNQLQSLPESIGDLAALEELHIDHNQLRFLPANIGNLTALRKLDVGWNQLQSLPDKIGNLTTLNLLDVAWNKLRFLPANIGNLTALEVLDVSDNQLQDLPASIDTLRKKGCQINISRQST